MTCDFTLEKQKFCLFSVFTHRKPQPGSKLQTLQASGDALGKPTTHGVLLPEVGSIEEVVSRLLEGGQHQHTLLHLGQAKPSDAQDFTLSRETPVTLAPMPLLKAHTKPCPRHLLNRRSKNPPNTGVAQVTTSGVRRILTATVPPASVRPPASGNTDPYTHQQGPWNKNQESREKRALPEDRHDFSKSLTQLTNHRAGIELSACRCFHPK